MFYTKWRFEQHPHTHLCAHTQIQVWFLAFWCSCQICVGLLYMYITISPIHVEGMPVTGGVCRGASHLPNSLIYKKVPQIAVCEQSKSEKLGILCIFGQRNSLKFRKGSSFVRFHPLRQKKNSGFFFFFFFFLQKCPHSENQEEIHFWKICTLLRQKSLVWAWLKPFKCIGLGSKGGLGSWSPSIFWWGVGESFSPPSQKKSYILKNLD